MADHTTPEQPGPHQAATGDSGPPPPDEVQIDIHRLIADHHLALYRYAYRLSGSQTDAEDLTQQTYLIAQQKLHQLREPEHADRWLMAILRSCFLKQRRKKVPVTATTLDLGIDNIAEDPAEPLPIDRQELQAAINQLSDDFRIVVLMFYFEQSSYKEIAAQLEIPMGTVMSRLARAKQHLRQSLTRDET